MAAILSTKLYMPELRGSRIERTNLIEKMAGGVRRNQKLTLVSAPAGYGKTSLVLSLLKVLPCKSAWISLDANDNDFPQFLSYCLAALKKAGLAIGADTEAMLFDANFASVQTAMTLLINEIAVSPEKIILVLDDFHLIHSEPVHAAVRFLLEHQPPNFHLVIISREDPHLPLANLRVQQEITEIRLQDLCFTAEESERFLQDVMGLQLSKSAVSAVASRTEGWAAGLQLVGLSLSGAAEWDVEEFIDLLTHTHRYIIDYLVEEVINRQTASIRDFLCKTAILDRMNGALCDFILGTNNSKQLLRDLEKANLFLIPLDAAKEWYRYHHLFADSLRAELTEKQEQELQKKAAEWFWAHGYHQEAVKHALKAGDPAYTVRLIEDSTEEAFQNAQLTTLVSWISALPENRIRASEILAVRKAWALYLIGRKAETIAYLHSLEEDYMPTAAPHNIGLLLSLKAIIAQQGGYGDPEAMAGQALQFLEPWDPMARISTLNTLGWAQELRGSAEEAYQTFQMAYQEALQLGCSFITTLSLKYLGACLNDLGRCSDAIALYATYIEKMQQQFGKLLPYIGVIDLSLAELYYERNELEQAKDCMTRGMELCRSISYGWTPSTEIILSRIRFATGERETAIQQMEAALLAAERENRTLLQGQIRAVLTELLLQAGRVEAAQTLALKLKIQTESTAEPAVAEVSLAYVRFLLYLKEAEQACRLLAGLENDPLQNKKFKVRLAAAILSAEAYGLVRDDKKAGEYLEKALQLAKPQGYRRLFLEDEELLQQLLCSLQKERAPQSRRLQEFLGISKFTAKTPVRINQPVSALQQAMLADTEPLSKRELEILSLIAAGLSNSAIAKTLYISENTTQWHISHIYAKLGVKNRTQAVLKANQLSLL